MSLTRLKGQLSEMSESVSQERSERASADTSLEQRVTGKVESHASKLGTKIDALQSCCNEKASSSDTVSSGDMISSSDTVSSGDMISSGGSSSSKTSSSSSSS